jgi:hypothetical protein
MSEKTQQKGSAETGLPATDWLLQTIVHTANETGAEIGVTLIVGGTVVSGLATSGQKYFEEFGKFFANSSVFTPEQRKSMEETYREFGDKRYTGLPAAELHYVHLRDVLIVRGTEPLKVPLFRVRLSTVDGFTIGSLKQA